jgi:galactitol-specific phosphotransferase system IIB component
MIKGTVDTVSSASVIIDQPSGNYIVLINQTLHTNQDNLNTWVRFFSGEEISYLFEDISCSVASGDSGALTMAQSFQSRLPEKQMSVQTENATLLMSRADCGKYDIIILSKEFAETYDMTTVDGASAMRIDVTGGSN